MSTPDAGRPQNVQPPVPVDPPKERAQAAKVKGGVGSRKDGFEVDRPSRFRGSDTPARLFITHDVKPGDTMWDIARKYYHKGGDFPEIAADNPNITNPNLIFPGGKILVAVGTVSPAPRNEGGISEAKPSPAEVVSQAEAEAELLKSYIEAAEAYSSLNQGGVFAVLVPGDWTEDGLNRIADWINTAKDDNPLLATLKLVAGAAGMGVWLVLAQIPDAASTVGQLGRRATGTDPEGSELKGRELRQTRDQLEATENFIKQQP